MTFFCSFLFLFFLFIFSFNLIFFPCLFFSSFFSVVFAMWNKMKIYIYLYVQKNNLTFTFLNEMRNKKKTIRGNSSQKKWTHRDTKVTGRQKKLLPTTITTTTTTTTFLPPLDHQIRRPWTCLKKRKRNTLSTYTHTHSQTK